jgi:endothelin-converting enzyme/putative endopeptidase
MKTRLYLFAILTLLTANALAQSSSLPNLRFDLNNLDRKVDPCVNFYQFACGGWMAKNPIPSDQSRWGQFAALNERNMLVLKDILDKASTPDPKRSPVMQKIGDMYASCMDEATINKLGAKPIEPLLARVQAIKTTKDLIDTVAYLHGQGIGSLFNMYSGPDMHDAKMTIAYVDQGGLGLPDRDYYLKEDEKSKETREKYVAHVQKMLELSGLSADEAKAGAAKVMEIESSLAKAAMDRAARRVPKNRDHRMSTAELKALAPNFLFTDYFDSRKGPAFQSLNVTNPEFFKQVNPLVSSVSLADWKTYLRWHIVRVNAPWLSEPFVQENFAFNQQYMNGQKEIKARWKRCVRLVDGDLGEALAQPYVEETFGADGKQRTLDMVHHIEKAMSEDFKTLPWMSDPTKKQAQVKLDAIANHIGYPEKWRDYSTVDIKRGDLVGDDLRATAFEERRELNKIGKPVDRYEWEMTPPTVNAYYRAPMNDITFPAGILQPPFFDKTMDDPMNYGGIGAVIGHELTHGFDDQGSQYDAQGNLKSWWTPEDRTEFEKRTDCIVNEYAGFSPVDDVHLNGKLTLGENTADNGGVRIGLMALKDSMNGKEGPAKDGFTPEQRYFLGYATIWCQNVTPEAARSLATVDPHSPGEFRVNGVVSNMPEFQQAFGCKAGQPMVRENACHVW